VYRCIFSSSLGLCWRYKSIDKDRQQTPPSLPFACPRAKAKTLVVDQELLQCWLHFKYARFITKFSTAIWMNWLACLHVLPCCLWGFWHSLVLGSCKTEQMNRHAYWLFFLIDYHFEGFESFYKINIVPQMIHSIAQSVCVFLTKGFLTLPFFHPTIYIGFCGAW
jgi:hypothetical protein